MTLVSSSRHLLFLSKRLNRDQMWIHYFRLVISLLIISANYYLLYFLVKMSIFKTISSFCSCFSFHLLILLEKNTALADLLRKTFSVCGGKIICIATASFVYQLD